MKTASELSQTAIFDIATRSGILHCEFEREIKAIQLDAMKEGMRRATDKIQPLKYRGLFNMRNAILTAAEQLTEKDL